VTPPDVGQHQAQNLSSKLEDVITAAKPHLTNGEFQELKELLTEYEDIFARDDEDYGRTNKVYHCIDTGDARPILQPPRRIPLIKQAEVKEMLDDMERHGVIEESDTTEHLEHACAVLSICTLGLFERWNQGFESCSEQGSSHGLQYY
jgi:hypothetical protein